MATSRIILLNNMLSSLVRVRRDWTLHDWLGSMNIVWVLSCCSIIKLTHVDARGSYIIWWLVSRCGNTLPWWPGLSYIFGRGDLLAWWTSAEIIRKRRLYWRTIEWWIRTLDWNTSPHVLLFNVRLCHVVIMMNLLSTSCCRCWSGLALGRASSKASGRLRIRWLLFLALFG